MPCKLSQVNISCQYHNATIMTFCLGCTYVWCTVPLCTPKLFFCYYYLCCVLLLLPFIVLCIAAIVVCVVHYWCHCLPMLYVAAGAIATIVSAVCCCHCLCHYCHCHHIACAVCYRCHCFKCMLMLPLHVLYIAGTIAVATAIVCAVHSCCYCLFCISTPPLHILAAIAYAIILLLPFYTSTIIVYTICYCYHCLCFTLVSLLLMLYVTGSAKTWHNHTSLNLQYKPMITMCKILTNLKKNCKIFLSEKGKNLITSYLPIQEKLKNLCFVSVDKRICLRHAKTIDFSSQILSLHMVKEGDTRKNLPSNRFPYSRGIWWCTLQLHVIFQP